MRVLVVPAEFPSSQQPQAGIFIMRRLEALRELGHEFSILRILPYAPPITRKWAKYQRTPEHETIAGFPVHNVRAPIPPRMIAIEYLPLLLTGLLQREIRRFKPDIVHASYLLPCGQLVSRQHAVPSVVTSHGVDAHTWPQRRAGIRRACSEAVANATRVTAVSGAIGARLRELADREIDVIWNGGDERFFFPRDRGECRERLGLPSDRPVAVFAGNFIRAKGVYELVEAAAAMGDVNPVLLFAGDGPEQEALAALAGDRGVDLRFLGRLESARLGEVFGAADVVTLPSYAEGLPNVVCEAMLSGRAVVASTAGGTPEIVMPERTGLLIEPRSTAELASALRRVLGNVQLRDKLAQGAREFAQEHLTWRVSARGYDRVYRRALGAA